MKKVRVLIAKPGLDGHDRGAKVIAKFLQESGYEVIYTGLHQSPEQIVNAALQEAVDAIGISVLSGSHNYVFPEVMELLRAKGWRTWWCSAGGTIPEDEIPALMASRGEGPVPAGHPAGGGAAVHEGERGVRGEAPVAGCPGVRGGMSARLYSAPSPRGDAGAGRKWWQAVAARFDVDPPRTPGQPATGLRGNWGVVVAPGRGASRCLSIPSIP